LDFFEANNSRIVITAVAQYPPPSGGFYLKRSLAINPFVTRFGLRITFWRDFLRHDGDRKGLNGGWAGQCPLAFSLRSNLVRTSIKLRPDWEALCAWKSVYCGHLRSSSRLDAWVICRRRLRAARLRSRLSNSSKSNIRRTRSGRRTTSIFCLRGIARTSRICIWRMQMAADCLSRLRRFPKAEWPMRSGAKRARAFVSCTKQSCGRSPRREARPSLRGASQTAAVDSFRLLTGNASRLFAAIARKSRAREREAI